ncbi:MAG: DsbA family protein, partial [Nanoarchaeota archaeon]
LVCGKLLRVFLILQRFINAAGHCLKHTIMKEATYMNPTTPAPSNSTSSSNWKYATFFLAGIIIAAIVILVLNQGGVTGNVVKGPAAPNAPVKISADKIANAPVKGNANAPVTIVEFSDYQCPYCRKFWNEAYSSIVDSYVNTGKAKIVFMDFPLSFHPQAQKSAEAARCARKVGGNDVAYWKMHDKMFEEQMALDDGTVKSTVSYTESDLKSWAQELGYNIGSCLDSDEFADEVQADAAYGAQLGVSGTPAFFVNGKLLSGAQPFSAFKAEIDAELA